MGVPSKIPALQILKGLLSGTTTASADHSSVTAHPNVSASVPAISPARAGPLPRLQGHASRISPPPGRRPPGPPLAHAQRCHTRSHLAQTPSHLLPRSAGTLRTRPAPGRPAALPALPPAPARAPAARPPLAASFREPGRPLAAAMMVPSRDEGAPLKPRPRPAPSPRRSAELSCGLLRCLGATDSYCGSGSELER